MQNVNATVNLYKTVTTQSGGFPTAFISPLDRVSAQKENGQYYIDDFVVVTQIGIIGERAETVATYADVSASNNVITRKGCLNVKVMLTLPSHRTVLPLDEFCIEIKDMEVCTQACYPFVNYQKTIRIPRISIPSEHDIYVIKILIKEYHEDESAYQHQAMHTLLVSADHSS